MFASLFASGAEKKNAYSIYQALVAQARSSHFYEQLQVPDTIEGRFDMILLHLCLVDQRLDTEGEGFHRLRRFIQEALVSDMDRSLRELGVGDMSVGKEMKKVGAALLGRKAAYAAALDAEDVNGTLEDAIIKNVYGETQSEFAPQLVEYFLNTKENLADQGLTDPKNCQLIFSN